jgi:FixJ family two-component response regulator
MQMRVQDARTLVVGTGFLRDVDLTVQESEGANRHLTATMDRFTGKKQQVRLTEHGEVVMVVFEFEDGAEFLPKHLQNSTLLWERDAER